MLARSGRGGGEFGLRAVKGDVYSANSEARGQLLKPHYCGGLETAYREGVTKNSCTPEGIPGPREPLRSHYSQRKQEQPWRRLGRSWGGGVGGEGSGEQPSWLEPRPAQETTEATVLIWAGTHSTAFPVPATLSTPGF